MGKIEDTGHYDFALKEIANTYGHSVSISQKAKGLEKFGHNLSVGTSFETIADLDDSNETFPTTTNDYTHFSSSSAADTMPFILEGHTVDASGNLTFVLQTITPVGQTKTALATPLFRVSRLVLAQSGVFGTTPTPPAGIIRVYKDTAVVAGVPTDITSTGIKVLAGEANSKKAQTSTSQYDYYILNTFTGNIGGSGGNAAYVTMVLETRDIKNGGAWLQRGRDIVIPVGASAEAVEEDPLLIVAPNHDVRIRAKADANTVEVEADFAGHLAIII